MALSIVDANTYYEENVLYFEEWELADDVVRQRALNNASNVLYRAYPSYVDPDTPVPVIAVYEQALWLLRMDSDIRMTEFGMVSTGVGDIQTGFDKDGFGLVAPAVVQIIGNPPEPGTNTGGTRRIGRSSSGRDGYIVGAECPTNPNNNTTYP